MNIVDKLPKRLHARARAALKEVWNAPTHQECLRSRDAYAAELPTTTNQFVSYSDEYTPEGAPVSLTSAAGSTPPALVDTGDLGALIDALRSECRLVGPTVREGAVVHAEITSKDDLPAGVAESRSGRYRLVAGDREIFGVAVGPQSWKPLFFPESVRLVS